MQITVQATEISIEYENLRVKGNVDEYNYLINSIFKDYFKRRIYLISNNCKLIDESGNRVSSLFFNWSENLNIKIWKNDLEFDIPISLPIGQTFKKIPERWINVNFLGYTGEATLNGKKIELKNKLELPPAQFTLETPYEKISFNLKNIYNEYDVYLTSEIIEKEIYFKRILNLFDLETGIEIIGENKSVWIPKNNDNIIISENALFTSPYGTIEKNKSIQFHGIPVFAYENNSIIYIISSYGEILTLGMRNIFRDMERAPASIIVENDSIYITTYGGKKFIIDLKTGGLYYNGTTSEISNNIKPHLEKYINLESKNILIKDNKLKITKKIYDNK